METQEILGNGENHMDMEEEIFQNCIPNPEKLCVAGFQKTAHGFYGIKKFPTLPFLAELTITAEGNVQGRVIDSDTKEEYLPFLTKTQIGSYVADVQEEYRLVLEELKTTGFVSLPAKLPQVERLKQHLLETYGEFPDFPFKKYPTFAVFRNRDNKKWYALVMHIPLCQFRPQEKSQIPIDVLNVKAPKEDIQDLTHRPGIYPAYHMNKSTWISIRLDQDVPDKLLFALVENSRRLTRGKQR